MHTLLIRLAGILYFSTLVGCAVVPSQIQLISAAAQQDKHLHDGNCLLPQMPMLATGLDVQALNPHHIALLNWNIYKIERSNWAEDFPKFAQEQDIITLQEALLTRPFESTLAQQQLHWTLNHAFLYGEYQTGVLMASRILPVTRCGLRTTEPVIRTPKTMLVQTYRIAGYAEPLLVANVHGINFSLGTESYTEQLIQLSEVITQHSGPVILAGDFNNWSDSRTAILETITSSLRLQAIPYQNHNRTRVFGHVIDHIYFRDLEVISHENPEVSSSDHNPIMVVFRVSPHQRIAHYPP